MIHGSTTGAPDRTIITVSLLIDCNNIVLTMLLLINGKDNEKKNPNILLK